MESSNRGRRSLFASVIAVVVLTAALVAPAAAITRGGQLDGNRHPHVGLMVAQTADGTPLWRCSGTLLSETVFLTAGHCTESPAAHVEIWFDADVTDAAAHNYPFVGDVGGTPYTHPDYNPNAFYLRDVGVVVLDEPYTATNGQFGRLPAEDSLDSLKPGNKTRFTAVGYGRQKSFPSAAAWKIQADRIRMFARPRLIQINNRPNTGDYSMLLSNNANTGGTCFGDSGGPNFLGNTNIVAGVTSYGRNVTCAGTGGVFRMDRSWSLDFVNGFLN